MLHIQILGIGCKKSKALKSNLLEAMRDVHLNIEVEEVDTVHDIVQYPVQSIPALLINGCAIVEGRIPEVMELQKVLSSFLQVTSAC